jgi:3-oxoacyl-[acyl-carrier protein] reductase
MNVQITNQLYIVGGATSGFGKAVAELLVQEGANIIAIARTKEKLHELKQKYPKQIEILAGDLTQPATIEELMQQIGTRQLHGVLINASGPPAKTVLETTLQDWDEAYKIILRWKVQLTQLLLPAMMHHRYGRLVYVESASVKQPMENLVLSNSLRLAVVGMVKTLSQEVGDQGITLNVLAPGFHDTPAMERLFKKKSVQAGITEDQAKESYTKQIKAGKLGDVGNFASLALWLLSPASEYVTGQTISVDGGVIKGVFG